MRRLELQLDSDDPSFSVEYELDRAVYTFKFDFNARMGIWTFSVADVLGNVLVAGVPLYVGQDLLSRFSRPGLPPGMLYAFDTTGNDENPGRYDLGTRTAVIYQEAAE